MLRTQDISLPTPSKTGGKPLMQALGFVAQNVFLYCTSERLGSVVRIMFNKESLSKLLKLKPNQKVLLTQIVGWPE